MKQEAINKLVIEGFPKQFDIYQDLKNSPHITTAAILRAIRRHKDDVTGFLSDLIQSQNKTSWSYQEAEDMIQYLYSEYYEFFMLNMSIYGQTPKGYRMAVKKWKQHYKTNIRT